MSKFAQGGLRTHDGRVLLTAATFFLLAGAVVGCSDQGSEAANGESSTITSAIVQNFEGVYGLTGRTLNPAACQLGSSVLDTTTDLAFVLVGSSVLGQQTIELVSCKPDTCAETAQKTKALTIVGSEYRYSFSKAKGVDGLTGFMAWSGGDNGSGTCTERTFDEFTLTKSGDAIHVERTTKALEDAPAEDGFCFADPAQEKKEAEGAPCSEMETLDAKWSAALP